MYTVYKHTTPDNKVYIGITARSVKERWRNGKGYPHSEYFNKAINEFGWENIKHEVLFTGLTQIEAEEKEIELIKEYKANDRAYGYNIDEGGLKNKRRTESTKRKISRAHIGLKHTEETKKKISLLKMGNKNRLGYKMSDAQKRHFSEIMRGRFSGEKNYFHDHKFIGADNWRSKKVDKFDKNGNYLETKECAEAFARELGIKNASHITQVCRGKRRTAYGFIWKYREEGVNSEPV